MQKKKKLHWSIYSAPDSAKKQQQQFTYGQTVQKNNKQFTYGIHMVLWYQQLMGDSALNLIGYVSYTNPTTEDQYKNQFSIGGNGAKSSTLNVTLERKHVGNTAVYYCAASKAQC